MNAHGGTKLQSEYGEQKVVLVTCCWKQTFNNWANNDFETYHHQKQKQNTWQRGVTMLSNLHAYNKCSLLDF